MKKLIRSRKGFTLLEITIVVAIIVILAAASLVGVAAILKNANKNSTAVELHAGAWYIDKDPDAYANEDDAAKDGYYWYNMGGTGKWVKVVPKGSDENAKYWSDWDEMYAQVNAINVVTPMPQSGGYNPGGSGGLNPGTGGSGSGGSGSAGHHTQSASDMLKEFLEHYGIPYTENGGSITWNHDGDYGGQSFADAWNQWKKDHTNSTGGGSSSGGNNVSTGGSGSGSSGSSSGSTGGSGSSGSGSSGSSGSGNGNGSGNTSSVGADSSTVTLNAPSEYNLQASNQSFSGNGKPITKLTITISDGATFTNVSAYDNGGKYKMTKSDDNKTVTITFDSSLGWASPESTLKVGNIQWSGSQNVQITYGFEYA